MNSKEILVFNAFVNAINKADTKALKNLMSEDHIFIDSAGLKEKNN